MGVLEGVLICSPGVTGVRLCLAVDALYDVGSEEAIKTHQVVFWCYEVTIIPNFLG